MNHGRTFFRTFTQKNVHSWLRIRTCGRRFFRVNVRKYVLPPKCAEECSSACEICLVSFVRKMVLPLVHAKEHSSVCSHGRTFFRMRSVRLIRKKFFCKLIRKNFFRKPLYLRKNFFCTYNV